MLDKLIHRFLDLRLVFKDLPVHLDELLLLSLNAVAHMINF